MMRTFVLCALLEAVLASIPTSEVKLSSLFITSQLNQLKMKCAQMTCNTQVEEANKVVDALLVEAKEFMVENGLDPASLEDLHESFSFKPILIEYHGELALTKGWLQDLSTLHRTGGASLNQNNDNLTITAQVGFQDFLFNYHYSAEIMNYGPSGEMDGKVSNVKLLISVDVDFLNHQIHLNRLIIQDVGKISVEWHGNVIIDWLTNILTGITTTLFKEIIDFFAENTLRDHLIEEIEHVNEVWSN